MKVLFFDFFSAFNTIWPALPGNKLRVMQVDPPHLMSLIMNSLPLHILHHGLNYCAETCPLQKFFCDSAIVGCVSTCDEEEYRTMKKDFNIKWYELKTKSNELVVDLRRNRVHLLEDVWDLL